MNHRRGSRSCPTKQDEYRYDPLIFSIGYRIGLHCTDSMIPTRSIYFIRYNNILM